MRGWHYGKGLIHYRPRIFRLTKLALLRARTLQLTEYFYFKLLWTLFNVPLLVKKRRSNKGCVKFFP